MKQSKMIEWRSELGLIEKPQIEELTEMLRQGTGSSWFISREDVYREDGSFNGFVIKFSNLEGFMRVQRVTLDELEAVRGDA